jgi:tRNA A-37 threonylcarbamoyl transferase component Bud32
MATPAPAISIALDPEELTPSGEQDAMLGKTLDGRYRIEARLGEGGLGSVYRAQHLKLDRAVAVKVLRADLRAVEALHQRFEREVRTLSSLTHPNIVTITDYGQVAGLPYLVMELAEGTELGALVTAGLSADRVIAIVRQILSSLAYAHARDVVHRDLKPANVIVRQLPDGRDHTVVLDFGLAKFVGDGATAAGEVDLTRSGLIVGTPAYLAPEMLGSGSRKADVRSDLYAVGLILFELLAGRRPFLAEDPAEMLRAHLVTPPPKLADVTPGAFVEPALEALVARALAKTPAERFGTAREMIDALDKLPPASMRRVAGAAPAAARILASEPTVRAPSEDMVRTSVARPRPPAARRVPVLLSVPLLAIVGVSVWALVSWARSGETTLPDAPTIPSIVDALGEPALPAPAIDPVPPPTPTDTTATVDEPTDEPMEFVLPVEPTGEDTELVADPTADEPAAPPDAVRPRARDPWRGSVPALLTRLYRRIQNGHELGRADLRALGRYRNDHPRDARSRLLLGHAFLQKGWLTAALDQYERACRVDLGARGDPELARGLVRIARTETLASRASDDVIAIFGDEACPAIARVRARETHEDALARLDALTARLGGCH